MRFNPIGRTSVIFSDKTEVNTSIISGQIEAYTKCAPLQDAINVKASYYSVHKVAAIDDKGNWIGGDTGTNAQKAIVKQDIKKILHFNENESSLRFHHRVMTQLCIFGECFIYKSKIIGFDEYNYYIIQNDIIEPIYYIPSEYDNNFEPKIKEWRICLPSGYLTLKNNEVVHIKGRLRGLSGRGLSPLIALKEPISTLLSMGQMLTQLLADGGARGIISQGARDVDMIASNFLMKEKEAVQEALKGYGLLRHQMKYIVMKGAANYVPLTSKIIDMQIPEIAQMKKIEVYRGFGLPTAFAIDESRFKVMPEARKEFISGSVTPDGEDLFCILLKMKNIPERDWRYIPDWSHLDLFQESIKESAIALQQAANGLQPLVKENILTKEQAISYLMPFLNQYAIY